MKKILTMALCVLIVMVLVLSGCGAPSNAPGSADNSNTTGGAANEDKEDSMPSVVMIPKYVGIPYYNRCLLGAEAAAKELGVNLIWDGPTTPDAAAQVQLCETYIAQGVDVLAVDPNDPVSMTPVLNRAKQLGITVIDWDSYCEPGVPLYSVHMIKDVEHAESLFERMASRIPSDGKYAIITGGLEAENLNHWMDIGWEYMKKNYPDITLVTDKIGTDEKQELAVAAAQDLIKAYPDLNAILCFTVNVPPAVAQVIQEQGLQDKIVVTGTGMPSSCGPYLEDGSLDVVQLWDTYKLGWLTVWVAQQAYLGNKLTNEMATPVPDMPVLDMDSDGVAIYMGPAQEFTKENYKNFDF
jgi:simple sugar transport system substrate-binding protein/rhamnose transport system substrate-binding protein